MPPDLRVDADWRRPAYALPLVFTSALVLLAAARLLLGLAGLSPRSPGLFAGTGPLATVVLLYLVLFEIPGRSLLLGGDAITVKSRFRTRTIAWTDIADVHPGTAAWMSVNRKLPVAARLVLHNSAQTVPLPNVFRLSRKDLYDRVRSHWLAARNHAAEVAAPP